MKREITIHAACSACRSTGLYCGFMEAKGEAVVCVNCQGTGRETFTYRPFTGRKPRLGVKSVRFGSGLIVDHPTDKSWMTYAEFEKTVKAPKPKKGKTS